MFALEITFQDGVSQPETIFIRRPQALIGDADSSHVVIEDMKGLDYQLYLSRDIGRKFRCRPVGTRPDLQIPGLLEGLYDGQAFFDLGPVKFHITALDSDLPVKETEPPDRAGVRIMRLACSGESPLFPAVVVQGPNPVVVSFVSDQPIFIGRSKHCALRLDSSDISAKHARVGYESGEFWVEDLGSTNGTFVNKVQISGRVDVPPGQPVTLGREIVILGVNNEEQIQAALRSAPEEKKVVSVPERKYPVLVSVSEVARPARLVLPIGSTVDIGRDPSCDMWLGAPHVSRKHCAVALSKTGNIQVTDSSTNGTAYDNKLLRKGDLLELTDTPKVFDFGGGVTVALCFTEEEESAFVSSHGSASVFNKTLAATPDTVPSGAFRRENAAAAETLSEEPAVASPKKKGLLNRLRGIYDPLSRRQKMVMILTVVMAAAVLMIVANLATPLFV